MSRMIALTAAGLLALSGVAVADESVDAQLQQLNDRMQQLEDQLDSANAKVEAQEKVIAEAELDEARPGSNALSAFIESTEIDAWVGASYNINFRNPQQTGSNGGATNQGVWGGLYEPFFPTSNTVQLDQAWIGINKAPTDESRAGFNLDLVAGAAAGASALVIDTNNGAVDVSAYGIGVYSAYASYMMPIMEGLTFDAGILPTAQGAEVQQITQNLNVTRGIVWGLQPVTNLGFTGTLAVSDSLSVMVGMLNNPLGLDGPQDSNNNKALTSRVNFGADKFSIGAGVNWGKNLASAPGTDFLLFNVVASVDPTENLTAYIDYTMQDNDLGGADAMVHGIAIATRLAVLDTTGIALRGEIAMDPDNALGSNLYSLTGTIDHSLTDNLTANVEVRWDKTENPGFWNADGAAPNKDSQILGIIQLVYQF